ncbi:MAG: quinol dehydrogenase ferredoxin subunit NapH [Ramlibacter sp.]
MSREAVGARAVAAKGLLRANKWLLARRLSQFGLLALFLAGPLFGLWLVKGNLGSSLTLDVLPLTDPYVLLQSLAAGYLPHATALTGAAIVLVFYAVLGGRLYCSWACPVNLVTDAAAWLRRKLRLPAGRTPNGRLRYWLLAATLAGSFATGTILWEWVNPITMLHRALLYGAGLALAIPLGVFLLELFVAPRGWCGNACPVGAFYASVGRWSALRVSAAGRANCDHCMDCYQVCPEPAVIKPALNGKAPQSPLILSPACTACGRCIDVCSVDVFHMTTRFDHRSQP